MSTVVTLSCSSSGQPFVGSRADPPSSPWSLGEHFYVVVNRKTPRQSASTSSPQAIGVSCPKHTHNDFGRCQVWFLGSVAHGDCTRKARAGIRPRPGHYCAVGGLQSGKPPAYLICAGGRDSSPTSPWTLLQVALFRFCFSKLVSSNVCLRDGSVVIVHRLRALGRATS